MSSVQKENRAENQSLSSMLGAEEGAELSLFKQQKSAPEDLSPASCTRHGR